MAEEPEDDQPGPDSDRLAGREGDSDGAEDRRLVDAANRGDRSAFDRLYRRHRAWMMAVALRLTGDPDRAADVMQSALVHWLGRFPGFALTGKLRAYLYPLLRHAAIDQGRRDRRRPTVSIDEEPPSPEAATAIREAKDLDEAVGRLPVGQREVILLHFGDGMTLAEVAQVLAIPLGTVKSRLGLALATLRSNERLRDLLAD